MGGEPALGPGNDAEELFCARRALKFSLALAFAYPEDGVVAVGIYGFLRPRPLNEGQGVDYGEELANVIGAIHRAKAEE